MPKQRSRLTIILVPETGRRPFSFAISRTWFGLFGAVIIGMVTAIAFLTLRGKVLQTDLLKMDDAKRLNRVQQVEINAMATKAQEVQDKLDELTRLEREIRDMTGDGGMPSRSFRTELSTAQHGGLPAPKSYIRDLPQGESPQRQALQDPTSHRSGSALQVAESVNQQMAVQLQTMDRLAGTLKRGEGEVRDRLDYLVHRPSGWPAWGAITDRFGWRWDPLGRGRMYHQGLDIGGDYGAPILATADGEVVQAGWLVGGYGYTVTIDHGYGFQTMYAHMSDWEVPVGRAVKRGEVVGWIGSTGHSTGPHLHYEVHADGVAVDPADYLD